MGINQIMLQDLGVTTIQFEFMGNAGFCFPIVIGRPMTQKGHGQRERNIYAPRDLLAVNLRYPVPDPLNRQSNPESVFY